MLSTYSISLSAFRTNRQEPRKCTFLIMKNKQKARKVNIFFLEQRKQLLDSICLVSPFIFKSLATKRSVSLLLLKFICSEKWLL